MGAGVLGGDDQARSLFVETVDQARTDSWSSAPLVQVEYQRIEQRAAVLAMRWVNQHSCWLVNDDQLVILENDIERNVLRTHRRSSRRVDDDLDKIIGSQPETPILMAPIDFASCGFHQIAKVHFAQPAKMVEQKILKPHLVMLGGGLYFDTVYHYKIVTQRRSGRVRGGNTTGRECVPCAPNRAHSLLVVFPPFAR